MESLIYNQCEINRCLSQTSVSFESVLLNMWLLCASLVLWRVRSW